MSAPREGQELQASLHQRHMTMIAIGGAIGAGLFVGSGSAISGAGPAAVLSYAVAGLLVMLVMRMLGEMVVAQPMKGSFSDYARLALGRGAGFTIGWLYWYSFVIIVAIEAVAGGAILHGWMPGVPPWVFSFVLLTMMTGVNLISVKSFAEFEFWFASIKVAAIIVFLALGTAFVVGMWPGRNGPDFSNLTAGGGFAPAGFAAALSSIVVVIFAFGGAEIVTIAAGESKEPEKSVAKATTSVIWRIAIFYIGSVFLVVAMVPWTQARPSLSPYVGALNALKIPYAGTVMEAIILTSVLSVLNSALYVSSRMLHVLTEHGDAPHALVKLNKRGVPARAILLGTTIGYLAVFAQHLSPDAVFAFLTNSAGAVAIFMYLIISASELRLRARLEREAPERLTFKMWGYPYLTYLVLIAFTVVLLAMAVMEKTRVELMTSLLSLGVVVGAYVVRNYLRRNVHPDVPVVVETPPVV